MRLIITIGDDCHREAVRRFASWFGVWLSAALLLCVPASAAGSGPVKHSVGASCARS